MASLQIEMANRVKDLPPYLFASIDKMKQEAIKKGVDIINLGVGDPDLPTPPEIVRAMQRAVENPLHHQYPSYDGMKSFREAVASWYDKRFGVSLDPDREVLTLIGSKEGIGHIPLALVNPGDAVLIPSPGYPVYQAATLLAGGQPCTFPLLKKNGFIPKLSEIPKSILQKSRLLFINYPNNPTAATADVAFFEELAAFAKENEIIVCHDAAYSEIFYDGNPQPSFLQARGAKEVGIEFHSLSKTFNMTGWRLGFAVGHEGVISALGKIKSNIDSGVFQAVQEAGITALNLGPAQLDAIRSTYQVRRDAFVPLIKALGFKVGIPKAAFYIWFETPKGYGSMEFTKLLLEKTGIVTTPGIGFGDAGEGYNRMTLTVPKERLLEAAQRIKKAGIQG